MLIMSLWINNIARTDISTLVLNSLLVPLQNKICNQPSYRRLAKNIWNYQDYLQHIHTCDMLCVVAQSCPTLCDPMDCSPPGSSVHGDSPGKNTGVGCHALLQRIFPTQGSNPGLLHCRQILHCLSHQGSPRILTGAGSLSVLWGIFPTWGWTGRLLHCRCALYQLSCRRSPCPYIYAYIFF